MTLALFPLGVISVYQTNKLLDEAEESRIAALFAETSYGARDERELILQTLGRAEGLAASLNLADNAACQRTMREFVETNSTSAFAGFVNMDGIMSCSSTDDPVDFSDTQRFAAALEADGPVVQVIPSGTVTGQPILAISQPVWRDRARAGFVLVSVPLRFADALTREAGNAEDLQVVTFTKSGEIITATGGRPNADAILPNDIPLSEIATRGGETFEARTPDGQMRVFAVVGVFEDQVKVVGSRLVAGSAWGGLASQRLAALLFPFAIWGVGLVVAYLGLHRLVIRHIRDLRSGLRKFALGDRSVFPLALHEPPAELAETERAFNRMAILITDGEIQQAKDLEEKEVLLKEVHHRVKNNLQMIASIMNMQSRKAKSDEAKLVLANLQRRVNGLAMLHRTLYTSPDLVTIDSDDLLQAVVRDVVNMLTIPGIDIQYDLDEIEIYPDQAVPLSMLLAEAVTNALKYAGRPKDGSAWLKIALRKKEGAEVELSIVNSKGTQISENETDMEAGGLGTRLMQAFVAQLDAELVVDDQDEVYAMHVTFERRGFEAETG